MLPEKWFVKYRNENEFKTCVKWANELRRKENSFAVCMAGNEYSFAVCMVGNEYPDCKTKYLTWDAKFFDIGYILSDDKVEITYDKFLKYVLKQEKKLKGKIIGYKVPYDL